MKLKVPHKNYGVAELYDAIATEMGFVSTQNLEYDCREVNIAQNIQDGIYDKYLELGRAQGMSDKDIRLSVTMVLVISGPKVDETLEDDEVEVFEGFIY